MRLGGCAAGLALLLAACHGAGHTPDTLPPTSSSTTATSVDYSIPPVIDAPYVTKVMKALDHVLGDAIRSVAVHRSTDDDFVRRIAAIYGQHEFSNIRDLWTKDVATGLEGLAPHPGDPVTTIQTLLRMDRTCIVAAVKRDFSATRTTPARETPQRYIGLIPIDPARDPDHLNPTPWRMAFDGYIIDGSVPKQPCRSD